MDTNGNDHARPSAASGPSRRAFFGAAGALGVAGAAFQLLPARAAGASPALRANEVKGSVKEAAESADTVPLVPFAGADRGAFESMLNDDLLLDGGLVTLLSPPPTAVRWYIDEETYPNTTPGSYSKPISEGGKIGGWPKVADLYNGSTAHALVSIRPDINLLLGGQFDDDLTAFMNSAPPGPASLLTIWHEVASDTFGNPNYPQLADAPTFLKALSHLHDLAKGTNVQIGAVNIRPTGFKRDPTFQNGYPPSMSAQDIYNMWMPANLDWYGCDLYDNPSFDVSAYDELNAFRACANGLPGSVEGADWPINIPEINSPIANPNSTPVESTIATTNSPTGFRRSDFFHYAWTWLQTIAPASHCAGLLGFWNGLGNEGSPWPPNDWPQGSFEALVTEIETENGQSWP